MCHRAAGGAVYGSESLAVADYTSVRCTEQLILRAPYAVCKFKGFTLSRRYGVALALTILDSAVCLLSWWITIDAAYYAYYAYGYASFVEHDTWRIILVIVSLEPTSVAS